MWSSSYLRDLLIPISKTLNKEDVLNLRLVCKNWNYFISEHAKKKYVKHLKKDEDLLGLSYGWKDLIFHIKVSYIPEGVRSVFLKKTIPIIFPSTLKTIMIITKEEFQVFDLSILPKNLKTLSLKIDKKCVFYGELPENLTYLSLTSRSKEEVEFPFKLFETLKFLNIRYYSNIKFPKNLEILKINYSKELDLSELNELKQLHIYQSGSQETSNVYISPKLKILGLNIKNVKLIIKNNIIERLVINESLNRKFDKVISIKTKYETLLDMINKKEIDVNKIEKISITSGFSQEIDCNILPVFPNLKYIGFLNCRNIINKESLYKNKRLKRTYPADLISFLN